MTDRELKTLKDNLWHAADVLRSGAHLAANKYGQPILGLIFLRYADILFKQHKDEIDAEYTKRLGTRMEKTSKEIAVEKCGFFLPECAYYDFINDAPDTAEKADLVKKAMEAIERENPKMEGVLPKEVYAQLVPEEEPELLSNIVRIFKDIPENCTVDIFGEIYEYFLGNFALAEGKDGGTFYTPATVVRYMVEVLDPQPGDKKFLDPACGSGNFLTETYLELRRIENRILADLDRDGQLALDFRRFARHVIVGQAIGQPVALFHEDATAVQTAPRHDAHVRLEVARVALSAPAAGQREQQKKQYRPEKREYSGLSRECRKCHDTLPFRVSRVLSAPFRRNRTDDRPQECASSRRGSCRAPRERRSFWRTVGSRKSRCTRSWATGARS